MNLGAYLDKSEPNKSSFILVTGGTTQASTHETTKVQAANIKSEFNVSTIYSECVKTPTLILYSDNN